ncbi:uncharacterized protein LOC117642763 isoform X2 [Thrips palmi]|uniref:Uncharacterized protein LOC117642763 isoform X2 n=1 Tax=Thrips palmi TaxID=161013 RepID=A0A6P8YSZ7_THRPL|nr:uncharacterized protein LOC117642763 isoform X2 [Thrips palmi]
MDSDSSDYMVGHHEEWDDTPGQECQQAESPESQIDSLRHELKQTKELLKHMEWHCHVYRMALQNVPGGLAALHEAHQVIENATSPTCNACERDSMLKRIQDLENSQGGSPIFHSTYSRKKREGRKEKQQ